MKTVSNGPSVTNCNIDVIEQTIDMYLRLMTIISTINPSTTDPRKIRKSMQYDKRSRSMILKERWPTFRALLP